MENLMSLLLLGSLIQEAAGTRAHANMLTLAC